VGSLEKGEILVFLMLQYSPKQFSILIKPFTSLSFFSNSPLAIFVHLLEILQKIGGFFSLSQNQNHASWLDGAILKISRNLLHSYA
jgi:hypothetical protein